MLELRWDRNGEGEGSRYTYMIAAGDIRPFPHYNILHASTKGGKLYH